MIPKLPSHQFYWHRWRAGSFIDLEVKARYWDITSLDGIKKLKKHAVGYCDGMKLPVRQKKDAIAVMYFKDGRHFWSHLYINEFKEVFRNPEID